MTTPTPEAIEAAAAVGAVGRIVTNGSNWPDAVAPHMLGRDLSKPIGLIVDALAPVIAQAKAEALREAADALDLPGSNAHGYYSGHADFGYSEAETHAGNWLRARAATIEGKSE